MTEAHSGGFERGELNLGGNIPSGQDNEQPAVSRLLTLVAIALAVLMVGLWNGEDLDATKQRLAEAGASQVATDLREAVSCVERLGPTVPRRFRAGDGL